MLAGGRARKRNLLIEDDGHRQLNEHCIPAWCNRGTPIEMCRYAVLYSSDDIGKYLESLLAKLVRVINKGRFEIVRGQFIWRQRLMPSAGRASARPVNLLPKCLTPDVTRRQRRRSRAEAASAIMKRRWMKPDYLVMMVATAMPDINDITVLIAANFGENARNAGKDACDVLGDLMLCARRPRHAG